MEITLRTTQAKLCGGAKKFLKSLGGINPVHGQVDWAAAEGWWGITSLE